MDQNELISEILKVPMPHSENYQVMVIDIDRFKEELRHDAKEKEIDAYDFYLRSAWTCDFFDPESVLADLKQAKLNVGILITGPSDVMDPDSILHEVAYNNLHNLMNLGDNEFDSEVKSYLAKVVKLCNPSLKGSYFDIEMAVPDDSSRCVLRDSWNLEQK